VNVRWIKIDCRQAHWLLSRRRDDPLPAGDRLRLWLHLAICDWCSRVARHFDFLSRALKGLDR
jgi:hypothetical protein